MSSVTVSFCSSGQTAVVEPVGEFDLSDADALREVLLEECVQARLIVIDFRRTTFIDSTILGVIVLAYKRLDARDGQVIGVNACPQVLKVLTITGIDALLQMHADLHDDVAAQVLLRPTPAPPAATASARAALDR